MDFSSESFSSLEEVSEDLDDLDDYDWDDQSPGPHLLATCAARGLACSSEGGRSSPATLEANSIHHREVEELQIASKIADDGSKDASLASKKGSPAPASCAIAACALQDVMDFHNTQDKAEVQFRPPP